MLSSLSGSGWAVVEIHQAIWLKTTISFGYLAGVKRKRPKNSVIGEYRFGKIVAQATVIKVV